MENQKNLLTFPFPYPPSFSKGFIFPCINTDFLWGRFGDMSDGQAWYGG